MDMSMPAILGYLSAMFYNPNNVAFEASPFTTLLELEVGRQLCDMLGYNTDVEKPDLPLAGGHITCDGSVANLESLWYVSNVYICLTLTYSWFTWTKNEGIVSTIPYPLSTHVCNPLS